MEKYFSISTGGFYESDLRGRYELAGSWPSDAVEIDEKTELKLRNAISRGDVISKDNTGWRITPFVVSAEKLFSDMQGEARALLSQSDITIIRCVEIGISVPIEWVGYRLCLRSIISGTHADALPERPPYPDE